MFPVEQLLIVPLLILLLMAVRFDVARRRIPNLLTFSGLLLGISLQAWHLGLDGLLQGFSGAGVGFGIFLLLYILGSMGAGDVKLMAAVGAFLGPNGAFWAAALTMIAGGAIGILVITLRGGGLAMLKRYWSTLKCFLFTAKWSYVPPRPDEAAATRFPYAPAIALGTLAALWHLALLQPFVNSIGKLI